MTRLTDAEVWARIELDPGDSWLVDVGGGRYVLTGYTAEGSSIGLVERARRIIEEEERREAHVAADR